MTKPTSIFAALAEAAGHQGGLALIAGERAWSATEMLHNAELLAERLAGYGVGTELAASLNDPVATAVVTLAADLAGIRLTHRDPEIPLAQTAVPWVHDGSRHTPAAGESRWVDATGTTALWFRRAAADGRKELNEVPPSTQIFMTSGSTGTPTGVVRSADAVMEDAHRVAQFLGYRPGAPVVCAAPLFHAYGFNYGLIAPLLAQAPVHVLPSRSLPSRYAAAVRGIGARTLIALPFHYRVLVNDPRARKMDSLHAGVSAGAPLDADTLERATDLLPFPLYNCYGSSEAGAVTLSPVEARQEPGFIGSPLPGVEACIDSGELLLRSSSLALGRVADDSPGGLAPLVDTDGWYRTGDLADSCAAAPAHPDGAVPTPPRLRLRGRTTNVINVAGEKVSPALVEQTLARHHAVVDVHVRGEADASRGQVPVARVVLNPGTGVDELTAWCRQNLAPQEVPRRFDVVLRIPRSSTGKPLSWTGPGNRS
ncbi:fatty acid--CoA ligase family protein [Streptomyces sp. NPDC005283]|uniref:class I adenylate-forming enzyme family protein n=1 Tax=Streptomyces sp. NPDC005283 TaxID=3156871 RepID=UPI0034560899